MGVESDLAMRVIVNWLFNGWSLQWWENAIIAFLIAASSMWTHLRGEPISFIDLVDASIIYMQVYMMAKKPVSRDKIEEHNLC